MKPGHSSPETEAVSCCGRVVQEIEEAYGEESSKAAAASALLITTLAEALKSGQQAYSGTCSAAPSASKKGARGTSKSGNVRPNPQNRTQGGMELVLPCFKKG